MDFFLNDGAGTTMPLLMQCVERDVGQVQIRTGRENVNDVRCVYAPICATDALSPPVARSYRARRLWRTPPQVGNCRSIEQLHHFARVAISGNADERALSKT